MPTTLRTATVIPDNERWLHEPKAAANLDSAIAWSITHNASDGNKEVNMKYPIAIEPGNDTTAWGVVVPDLPGCFSAADDGIDQAIKNAEEAIGLWIEDAISNGESIPKPSNITDLQKTGEYDGWIWAIAEVIRP